MKKFFALTTILLLVLATCQQPTDNNPVQTTKLPTLTIRNLSSFDLKDVRFSSGVTFTAPGLNNLPKQSSSTKELLAGDLNTLGYITFTREDIGISCRMEEEIVIRQENTLDIFDFKMVIEVGNNNNKKSLDQITFLSQVAVEYEGFVVEKNNTVNFGEAVFNTTKPNDFSLMNTGVGKLLLTGTEPVKVDGEEAGIFTVVQPTDKEILTNDSLPFRINFTPQEAKTYTATVKISSNDERGDFNFTVTGIGVAPKPIAVVFVEGNETPILQDETISAGDVLITQSENITLIIKNTGTMALTIATADISITGTNANAFTKITNPAFNIQPNSQSQFIIKYEPIDQGQNNATLTIPTNDDSRNPILVHLQGMAIKGSAIPELSRTGEIIPNNSITPYDFGRIEIGQGLFQSLTFTITNKGNIPLELIGNPALESTNPVFTVFTQPSTNTIIPGANTSFIIRYTPLTEGENTGSIIITYNDNEQFILNVKGTGYVKRPQISVFYGVTEVSPNGTIDAGEVLVTLSKNINVEIRNTGEAGLTIDTENITITGTDAAVFTRISYPAVSIQPGNSSLFTIRCMPDKVGENNAILTIPTNDSFRNPFVINLKTTGVKGNAIPELSQGSTIITNNSLTPVDFGTVELGMYQSLMFTITNNGNIALELIGETPVESTNPVFAVSTQPSPNTIAPAANTSFMVRYTPTSEGEDTGKITFTYNENAQFVLNVKGTGYMKKPQISVFYEETEIPQNGTVDAGEVLVTLSININIGIRNTGEAVLTIDTGNITITGTDAAAFERISYPAVSMGVGASSLFTIRCAPTKVGENSAILQIPTNDNSRNPFVINLKTTGVKGDAIPELSQGSTVIANNSLTPIDFETVDLGSSKNLTFNITNNGNIALLLTGTPAVESSNTVFTIPSQPANTTINPGATVSFIIRYTPTAENEDTGTVTIADNSDAMLFTFLVKGTGYEKKPQITVRQGSTSINPNGEYDFGTVAIGEPRTITFTVGNSGDANLTFENVDSNRINLANNDAGLFTVTEQPSSTTAVAPGSTTIFAIRFNPTSVGSNFTATVHIKTNSRDNDNFAFTVKGSSMLVAPTNVTAVFQQPSSILVSWNPVPGATSYKVFYGTSSSAITTLASSSVTGTSYTHTGLLNGTTYFYCITAQDDMGESDRSQIASMITLPGVPANLRRTASTQNSISMAWDAVTGATSYRVYYATSDMGSKTLAGTASSGTTYAHTGLSANTTYYYFVTAVNSTGEGEYTEALTERTLLAPLSAPSNVTATALSTNSIQVTWGEVVGAIGYRVYRATSLTGTRTLLDTVTTNTYTNEGLSPVTYWYFITALNADNVESALSASASMIPKPNVPTNVSASSGSGSFRVTVNWNTVSGAASYRIYYATSQTGTKSLAGTSTSRPYYHDGGAANTTYYYWVTAVNAAGESDYSLYTADASALTPPAAPLNLRQTGSTTTSVTIAWDSVPGATRYTAGGQTAWTGTDTTLTITGCSPQTDYWFWVEAYNSAGQYGPSTEIITSTK